MITSYTLSTYKVNTYTMHKAVQTTESIDSSIETGAFGIGRTEQEAVENCMENAAIGKNCFDHLNSPSDL